MKKKLKVILSYLGFSFFLLELVYNRRFKYRLKNTVKGGILEVLANGPSLKDKVDQLKNENFNKSNFIVLNYFASDDFFFLLKPQHYCLADPMFFNKSHKIDQVQKLYKRLDENIDWKLNIYIPSNNLDSLKQFWKFTNPLINIVPVNANKYIGPENFRNFFYLKGLAQPEIFTVANLAIYVGLTLGFKRLFLFGVEHTFFDNISINSKNELCNTEKHFYSKTEKLKPIIRNDNGLNWKISDYTSNISRMFKSHDLLAKYGEYVNAEIINCTENSLIDSYQRLNRSTSEIN